MQPEYNLLAGKRDAAVVLWLYMWRWRKAICSRAGTVRRRSRGRPCPAQPPWLHLHAPLGLLPPQTAGASRQAPSSTTATCCCARRFPPAPRGWRRAPRPPPLACPGGPAGRLRTGTTWPCCAAGSRCRQVARLAPRSCEALRRQREGGGGAAHYSPRPRLIGLRLSTGSGGRRRRRRSRWALGAAQLVPASDASDANDAQAVGGGGPLPACRRTRWWRWRSCRGWKRCWSTAAPRRWVADR